MSTSAAPAHITSIRATKAYRGEEAWAQFHPDESGPPRFRLQRESEVPKLVAAMTSEPAAEDALATHRPDQLASERQERRQIVAIARMVCQATAEVLTGVRPAHQLRRWMEAEVHSKIKQRAALMARHRKDHTLRPQRLSFNAERATHPRTGVWEVSVVFTDEQRTRACAIRLQAYRGRWRVVALELA